MSKPSPDPQQLRLRPSRMRHMNAWLARYGAGSGSAESDEQPL